MHLWSFAILLLTVLVTGCTTGQSGRPQQQTSLEARQDAIVARLRASGDEQGAQRLEATLARLRQTAADRELPPAERRRRQLEALLQLAGETARRPNRGFWRVECTDDRTQPTRNCYVQQRVGSDELRIYASGALFGIPRPSTGGAGYALTNPRIRPDVNDGPYLWFRPSGAASHRWTRPGGNDDHDPLRDMLRSGSIYVSYAEWPSGRLVQRTFRTDGLVEAFRVAAERSEGRPPL